MMEIIRKDQGNLKRTLVTRDKDKEITVEVMIEEKTTSHQRIWKMNPLFQNLDDQT